MKTLDNNNLEIGQRVTVITWKNRYDLSYVGDIMMVMEVDLPFIVVNSKGLRIQLDTREVELGCPSELHVKLLRTEVASVATH